MGYFREEIEQMAGYTPGFQPKAKTVVKLNTNENPFPVTPKAIEFLHSVNAELLRRYPEPLGDTFRNAASAVLGIEPGNIICTNGGDDLLTICFRAFCDANRPVAFAQPTYSLYPVLARLQGCPIVEVDRGADGNLKALAEINAPLTIVCNPNAPTCEFIPVDKIADLAKKLDGVLLVDEAYADYAEDNTIRLIKDFDNIIILRSMSKGYSLAGLRFGFGIAQPNLIDGLMKVKDSYNVDALAINVAAAAISDQDYFRANIEKIKCQRQRLVDELNAMGMETAPSSTNFVFPRVTMMSAKEVYEKLAAENIFVRYFNLPGIEDRMRITVGTEKENDALLTALKKIIG